VSDLLLHGFAVLGVACALVSSVAAVVVLVVMPLVEWLARRPRFRWRVRA
jgi:hypothetical protein